MRIEFIVQERTEPDAKKKALESVDRLEESLQLISGKKKRSKHWKMKELAMRLRESSDKVNGDSV